MSGGGGAAGGVRPSGDAGMPDARSDAGDAADDDDSDDDSDEDSDEDEVLDDPGDAGMANTEDPDGDGDPSWPPPPATEQLQGLPEELASGICAALEGCLGETLLEVTLDVSDCEERTAAELRDGDFTFLQASIDAGRVVFDDDQLAACVTDYAALGCEVVASRAPASCKALIDGQVEVGDACVLDDDCTAGAFCDRDAACPGLCAELLGEGDDCDRNDQCESGLSCVDHECDEDAEEGDACDGGVAPPCHLGLLCIGEDPDEDQAGECMAADDVLVVDEGDPCDVLGGEWCKEGLACVVDVTGSGGSARVVTVCMERVGSGDACHTSLLPQQCPSGEYCPADLDPEFMADCAPRPISAQPCGWRIDSGANPRPCNNRAARASAE
jgi:hypothetical protein